MKMQMSSILAASILLSACTANFMKLDVKPSNEPMYNMTEGSHVLACVGNLIDRSSAPAVDVFISDIPDHTTTTVETGFLTKNAVMMVTTAVDRLGTQKVAIVGHNGGRQGRRQVQILGAWTELNRTTSSDAMKGTARFLDGFKLDLGGDRSFNHIALDMSMAEKNRIVPLTATSVSIMVNTESGNSTITYDNGGSYAAVAALGFTAQEGFHSAERLLVETSIALMMSRYYGIDLRDCLQKTEKNKNNIDKNVFLDPPVKAAAYNVKDAAEGNISVGREEDLNRFRSEADYLPTTEGGVAVLSRKGKSPKYLPSQPQEYTDRKAGDFSGTYETSAEQRNFTPSSAILPPEIEALQREAMQGAAMAQYNLGVAYAEGRGVIKNNEEALKWLGMAATQRHMQAEAYLGTLYYDMKAYQKAVYWFQKAAVRGGFEAQYNLAMLYAGGIGVPRNDQEAYFWLTVAHRQKKNADVERALDRMSAALPVNTRTEIINAAARWRPQP